VVLIDRRLIRAIAEKRLVQLAYKQTPARVVEPHDYGIQHGVARLLAYQVRGHSHSPMPRGWRLFDLEHISDVELLEERFAGSRTDAAQHHMQWDQLFARVS
jgi:predicted DNA-binding transcriptional regulator YafY